MAIGVVLYFALRTPQSRFTTPGDREDAAAANAARRPDARSPAGVRSAVRLFSGRRGTAELTGMAISVLDVRDTVRSAHVPVPAAVVATPTPSPRRLPVTVVAAGLIGVLESIGLLAVALTGLDGSWPRSAAPRRGWSPPVCSLLAGWIVLRGSGARHVRRRRPLLLQGVAYAEMAARRRPAGRRHGRRRSPTRTSLPLPALALLALAVPVGKLLLAGAPSVQRWIEQGPRARVRRPDPVQAHRLLATVTLGVIGAALCAVAVLAPVPAGDVQDPASSVFTQD